MLLGQAGEKPNQEQSNSMEEKSSPIFHFRPAKFQYSPPILAGFRQLIKDTSGADLMSACVHLRANQGVDSLTRGQPKPDGCDLDEGRVIFYPNPPHERN
jgi:hypothetical protein